MSAADDANKLAELVYRGYEPSKGVKVFRETGDGFEDPLYEYRRSVLGAEPPEDDVSEGLRKKAGRSRVHGVFAAIDDSAHSLECSACGHDAHVPAWRGVSVGLRDEEDLVRELDRARWWDEQRKTDEAAAALEAFVAAHADFVTNEEVLQALRARRAQNRPRPK